MFFGNKNSSTDAPNPSTVSASDRIGAENTRILSALAADYLKEKKNKRRWGLLIKLLALAYVCFVSYMYFNSNQPGISESHTALVELDGLIAPNAISSDMINESLKRAFESEQSAAVILRINSPGGTPVQAAEINAEIIRLKALYSDKPFYSVISDIGASGGYYVAVAADEIYGHPSSIIGSIGVRMDGFGFVDTLDKLGIERRLLSAGENKGMLDPFLPVNDKQKSHMEKTLGQVHQQFINAVKAGRGDRIADNPDIYSGLFWSGEEALNLGLIDSFGSIDDVAREVVGVEKIVDYTYYPSLFDSFADELGVSIANRLMEMATRIY